MLRKTLESRLIKCGAMKKDNTLKEWHKDAIRLIEYSVSNKTYKVHPFRWHNNGKRFSLEGMAARERIQAILTNVIGITPCFGNDAPKGGKEGDYIGIKTKDKPKVKREITNIIMMFCK